MAGDFNCILHSSEVHGGRQTWTPDMQSFKDCIQNSGLGHLKTVGELLTWTNKRPNDPIFKRLNRILGNMEWFTGFSDFVVFVKNRGIMDHNPLILSAPMHLQKFRKQFQYFHFMKDLPNFLDVIKTTWIFEQWYGDPMMIFNRRMKTVKQALIKLNSATENAHSNVAQSRVVVANIQDKLSLDNFNDNLICEERPAIKNLERDLKTEEQYKNTQTAESPRTVRATRTKQNRAKIIAIISEL